MCSCHILFIHNRNDEELGREMKAKRSPQLKYDIEDKGRP